MTHALEHPELVFDAAKARKFTRIKTGEAVEGYAVTWPVGVGGDFKTFSQPSGSTDCKACAPCTCCKPPRPARVRERDAGDVEKCVPCGVCGGRGIIEMHGGNFRLRRGDYVLRGADGRVFVAARINVEGGSTPEGKTVSAEYA